MAEDGVSVPIKGMKMGAVIMPDVLCPGTLSSHPGDPAKRRN